MIRPYVLAKFLYLGVHLVRTSAWLLAILPLAWVANFLVFLERAELEVTQPKWQHAHWARTTDPRTWPDPKDIGLSLHYESVGWLFFAVLVGTFLALPTLIAFLVGADETRKHRLTRTAVMAIATLIAAIIYKGGHVFWYLD